MNVIDISSYQSGINFTSLNPAPDGVIVKATEGISYVNPSLSAQANGARGLNELFGLYHYLTGGDATGEANFFLQNIQDYRGNVQLIADWESGGNGAWGDTGYLKTFLDTLKQNGWGTPWVYTSASTPRSQNFSAIAPTYPLWVAQYGSTGATGWQSPPSIWTDGQPLGAYGTYDITGGNPMIVGIQYTDNLQIGQNVGGLDGSYFNVTLGGTKDSNVNPTPSSPAGDLSSTNTGQNDPCGGIGIALGYTRPKTNKNFLRKSYNGRR